jgi:peptidoglycan hydrolase-like protein with peptidoglycan-binding domain
MGKRLVCLIIAAVLALGLIPGAALASDDNGMLKIGDQNEYVRTLQNRLAMLGYFSVSPTGYFGVITQQAIIDYQRDHDLMADGKLRSTTRDMLMNNKLSDANSADALSSTNCCPGDRSEVVAELQRRLKSLEYYKYDRITGYYGPVTRQAVERFQRVNGLEITGVAGRETMLLLSSGRAVSLCLYPGDRGHDVRQLQQRLIMLDYLAGEATGVLNDATVRALEEFKAQTGLRIDGRADQSTRERLAASNAPSWDGVQRISNSVSSTELGSLVDKMLPFAVSLLDKPYAYRTSGPASFDTDGFVCYVLRYMGAISADMDAATLSGMENWEKITNMNTLTRGDILFFTFDTGIIQAGISLGDGQFIHASAVRGSVVISRLSGQYQNHFCFARRVF